MECGERVDLINANICEFKPRDMTSKPVIDALYNIDDDLEKARIKAAMMVRAKELNIEKQFAAIIKAYDDAEKKLAAEYTRANKKSTPHGIGLAYDGRGQPLNTIDNFLMVVRLDPYFAGAKFNLLTSSPEREADGRTTQWTDADDSAARNYIEKAYGLHSREKLDDAMRILFREREYHPIRDKINALKWDGQERIDQFLTKWMLCDDTLYTREVSRLIFAGGINRLYNPGCKFDDVPVLIGVNQGEGKSTIVRWLAMRDEWFTEVTEIEGQKGMEAMQGAWICEIAELLALTRAKEVEGVKSYITRMVDRWRMPFDRRTTDHPRQCVFIGTTNKMQFLTDRTGNRRFYPVVVKQKRYAIFDHEAEIKAYIEQCWAEAYHKYKLGQMPPVASRELMAQIEAAQDAAVEDDYRVGMVEDFLDGKESTCIIEVWQKALGNELSKPTKRDCTDISVILQSLGWENTGKASRTVAYGVQKLWKKSGKVDGSDKCSPREKDRLGGGQTMLIGTPIDDDLSDVFPDGV